MNILITGTGFLGECLTNKVCSSARHQVVTLSRKYNPSIKESASQKIVEDISNLADATEMLGDIDVVIHTMARVHIMLNNDSDPIVEFRRVNVDGTLELARRAASKKVKRFIFISSLKVNGESTNEKPFTEQDKALPEDPYGISKMEAEDGLRAIAEETGMEVVIIRPPLIYGPGVKANFLKLIKIAALPIPLPFGAVNNKRSMVYLGNLVDFIITSIDHPAAANQTFLISDGEDLSLTSLLKRMRAAFNRSPLLIPIPVFLFKFAGTVTGKRNVIDRLTGNLQIDSAKARNLIGWTPPFTINEGIVNTINAYKNKAK
ncbi:UDP-glucose 4-epimerase family protein [Cellvibrio sp. QJXJ]|uniref:UDP-glucose 4-epimerase family protein n=1 Tax=Cellvibrio sp. QJXJ TaxID=2964606 RepID=UPI0021C3554B|nr:SDR family oxidoreductase [Cellvibrio sp. QJXJ]UUA71429.1 SDR family oxidoreductase [Cellvibrio sp. QJXJ]